MNNNENYFRISKNGHIHTLSDHIPLNWRELLVFNSASFTFLILTFGIGIGLYIAILTLIGYTLYRFASSFYYSELTIDEKSRKIIRLKKLFERTQKTELITENFDPNRFEFLALTRSGKTKFLMNYRTHKNNELLILRSENDKKLIKQYIAENLK